MALVDEMTNRTASELDARQRAVELIADPGARLEALESLVADFRADARYWRQEAEHYYGLWRADHPRRSVD